MRATEKADCALEISCSFNLFLCRIGFFMHALVNDVSADAFPAHRSLIRAMPWQTLPLPQISLGRRKQRRVKSLEGTYRAFHFSLWRLKQPFWYFSDRMIYFLRGEINPGLGPLRY